YFIATGVINDCAHRLSMAERRSEAYTVLNEGGWREFLAQCGVYVHTTPDLEMVVCGQNEADKIDVGQAASVQDDYLPDGTKGPCLYAMKLSVQADISPLVPGDIGWPGLTMPISTKICCRSDWENLGRDPDNGHYYLNE